MPFIGKIGLTQRPIYTRLKEYDNFRRKRKLSVNTSSEYSEKFARAFERPDEGTHQPNKAIQSELLFNTPPNIRENMLVVDWYCIETASYFCEKTQLHKTEGSILAEMAQKFYKLHNTREFFHIPEKEIPDFRKIFYRYKGYF